MGFYINPTDGNSKEYWLQQKAKMVSEGEIKDFTFSKNEPKILPVCLLDNILFTAAGIAYDERELNCFLVDNGRPKEWYLVNIEDLLNDGLANEDKELFKEALNRIN
jgi:hypothetical protein